MGNRCSRYWARQLSDYMTLRLLLPLHGYFLAQHMEQGARPILVFMGIMRAILPFAASFQGSRVGRQLVRSDGVEIASIGLVSD